MNSLFAITFFYVNCVANAILVFSAVDNLCRLKLCGILGAILLQIVCSIQGYKLAFDYPQDIEHRDRTWHGCPATIMSSPGDHVWGAVWRIQTDQLPNLDR